MEFLLLSALVLVIYFLPAYAAMHRKHKSVGAITIVNLLLGWTVVGWLWALIWANTGNVADAGPQVKCPDCAELVKREAKVCKHCGAKLTPQ